MVLLAVLVASPRKVSAQQGESKNVNKIFINPNAHIDVSSTAAYVGGTSVSPTGARIGVTRRYLTFNDKPWLPVMGEFHFSRYPEEGWEDEILKMKAGGVQVISTYVIWIHHEEVQGKFDWSGQRDLRHFVELCKKHGMYVYPRIGPWVHAEARNGGLPGWVIKESTPRENDPRYLAFVNAFDHEIGQQLKGLLWKDGGPVIGIQLENEYSNRSANGGAAHILELKRLARANGLDVPLYTVTGWDNAVYPKNEVLPVYGAYADAPWDLSNKHLPPNEAYMFRFDSRADGNMGAVPDAGPVLGVVPNHADPTPFLTAEVGAGLQDTYHRRPVVDADDVAVIPDVLVGSGANMVGYYMFHGGENPEGKLSTLNESRASHSLTDVPVKSYDFQAPLGEFGQQRPSFDRLRLLNYFLNDFGALLAPMSTQRPNFVPASASDLSVPRVAARTSRQGAFLFINNYVRGTTVPERKRLQVTLILNGRPITVPDAPVDVPSGAYFIWPVGIDLGGNHLNYSTAQLFTKITSGNETTYFFFAIPGIDPVFSFSGKSTLNIVNLSGKAQVGENGVVVSNLIPSYRVAFELRSNTGRRIRFVVLSRGQAEHLTKVSLKDGVHLVKFSGTAFANGAKIFLQSSADPHFLFGIYPDFPLNAEEGPSLRKRGSDGIFSNYSAEMPERKFTVRAVPIESPAFRNASFAQNSATTHTGVQSPPSEAVFREAPRWKLELSPTTMEGLSDLFLDISYKGNVARLYKGDLLLTDDFYNGTPWRIGLRYFTSHLHVPPLVISILPLKAGNDIVFENGVHLATSAGPLALLDHISVVPQYQFVIDTK